MEPIGIVAIMFFISVTLGIVYYLGIEEGKKQKVPKGLYQELERLRYIEKIYNKLIKDHYIENVNVYREQIVVDPNKNPPGRIIDVEAR